MKLLKIIFAFAISALVCTSCGASKQAVNSSTGGNVLRTEGLMIRSLAEESPSNRSWGSGSHFEESTAMRQAEANARGRFATAIQSKIKSGIEAYANATTVQSGSNAADDQNRARDLASRLDDYIFAISNECVTNTIAIKSELYDTPTNEILAYVCIEYREDVASMVKSVKTKLEQAIPDDVKEAIAFDKFLYEKKLDEAFKEYNSVSE